MQKLLTGNDAAWVARNIVGAGAVQLASPGQEFTFRSGIKSPVKIDMDMVVLNPIAAHVVECALEAYSHSFLRKEYEFDTQQLIFAGVPSGGVPWASMLANYFGAQFCKTEKLDIPQSFRLRLGQISGTCAVVVEDVCTGAGSTIGLVRSFRSLKLVCRVALAVLSYEFSSARQALTDEGVAGAYLVSFSDIIEVLKDSPSTYPASVIERLEAWHTDPAKLRNVPVFA